MLERCVQGSTVNQGMRCGKAGRYGVLTGQCQGYVLLGSVQRGNVQTSSSEGAICKEELIWIKITIVWRRK